MTRSTARAGLAALAVALGAVGPAIDARGAPADALPPLARSWYDDGRSLELRGDLEAAARQYRLVATLEPGAAFVRLDLGRVYADLGRPDDAIAQYRAQPFDADANEALGRLLLSLGRGDEAADVFRTVRDLRPEWPAVRLLEAQARATSAPDLAAGLVEEYLGFDGIDPAQDDLITVTTAVAEALRARGDHAAARVLLQDVRAAYPDQAEPLDDLVAAIEVDAQAQALAAAADVPLDPDQVAELQRAREVFAAGGVDRATAQLDALIDRAPSSAVTWATLADVREAAGDIAGADQAIRAAERLDPVSPLYPAKLGDLLLTWYAGRYDDEAVAAYGRAVVRGADDPDLWYRKAVAERRAGRWTLSVASFERVVALDPDGERADKARRAIDGATRVRPEPIALPSAPPRPGDLPEEAWWAFHRAWAWTHRTEPDAIDHALAELATARRLAPRFVRAIDLEAAIRADRGELDAAIAAYERSLTLAPDRGSVVGTLASLYRRSGRIEEADRLRERAAQLGDPQALWLRAQAQASSWRWWTARDTLATFFAHTSGGPAYEAALRLDAALARSIRIAWWTAGIGVVGVLLVPVGVRWRRRAGAPLSAVIAAAPHTWRDVARICSAIRHEVLKHHTSVLADVAVALDARDPEPARWVATRLFGRDQALDRLDGYLRELDAIGRANGVRLNLRDRDPVFGPLLAEVAHLRRLRRALRQGRGRRLAAELRTVSTGLNRLAYARLGRLVARLCVLRVDEALLRDVFAQVCGEFRDRDAPELAIAAPDEPLYVRMFRADLVDVLANLVRNAIEASPPDGGIGFALDVEEDPVTALDRVVIRVLDEAPGKLTTAMLRGRYVARGLGLAMDLTNRAGGSIHVEPVPEWSKGLVVRLPRAEIPDEED